MSKGLAWMGTTRGFAPERTDCLYVLRGNVRVFCSGRVPTFHCQLEREVSIPASGGGTPCDGQGAESYKSYER